MREIADREAMLKRRWKGRSTTCRYVLRLHEPWLVQSEHPSVVNFGKNKGLPISCFGTAVQDDTFDILRGAAEIGAIVVGG